MSVNEENPTEEIDVSPIPRVLFIGLDYHDYTKEIVLALERQGYKVDFHDIQPGTPKLKLIRKFLKAGYVNALDNYHESIILKSETFSYDYVLFLQVHQFRASSLQRLRNIHKNATFVLYNWDSIQNHNYLDRLQYFDRKLTFDPIDAAVHGQHYLPLFCLNELRDAKRSNVDSAIYFVGNIVNPKRYEIIQEFKLFCRERGIPFRYFLRASTHSYLSTVRAGFIPFDISLLSLSSRQIRDLMDSASTVFDFANHDQQGYTMRVIENLCAGKKIISNNQRLLSEDFYSPDRIFVYQSNDFDGVEDFINTALEDPYKPFPQFHIDNFAARLLGSNELTV